MPPPPAPADPSGGTPAESSPHDAATKVRARHPAVSQRSDNLGIERTPSLHFKLNALFLSRGWLTASAVSNLGPGPLRERLAGFRPEDLHAIFPGRFRTIERDVGSRDDGRGVAFA